MKLHIKRSLIADVKNGEEKENYISMHEKFFKNPQTTQFHLYGLTNDNAIDSKHYLYSS